jgi:hypothetical protein
MEKKVEQWWSSISPISAKRTITSHIDSLNTERTTVYAVENPGLCLGQAQQMAELNWLMPFFIQ